MVFGTIAAVLHGTALIIHVLLMTRVLNRFIDLTQLFCANDSVCESSNASMVGNIWFNTTLHIALQYVTGFEK